LTQRLAPGGIFSISLSMQTMQKRLLGWQVGGVPITAIAGELNSGIMIAAESARPAMANAGLIDFPRELLRFICRPPIRSHGTQKKAVCSTNSMARHSQSWRFRAHTMWLSNRSLGLGRTRSMQIANIHNLHDPEKLTLVLDPRDHAPPRVQSAMGYGVSPCPRTAVRRTARHAQLVPFWMSLFLSLLSSARLLSELGNAQSEIRKLQAMLEK
jgi:hypothetical protein